MTWVIDASVAFKALVPEEHSPLARAVIETDDRLFAPDFIAAEVGNVLWKRRRGGHMSDEDLTTVVAAFHGLGLSLIPTAGLLGAALRIATAHGRTVYDSLYLALASELDLPLITADEKLCNALRGTPLAPRVVWLARMEP